MPRGDKSAIMEYKVPNFDIFEQIKIANILSSLDDKIALNQRINDNLEWYAILYSINLFEIQIIMISSVLVAERLKSIGKIDLVA